MGETATEDIRSALESKLESEYDERLESETRRVREVYAERESAAQSEMAELRDSEERLQRECAAMQSEKGEWEGRVGEVMASKFRLIEATSREIDALRRKIRTYTN